MSSSSTQLTPSNLAVGAAVSLFEVTTLGQPLEVLKTHMASHRDDNLRSAVRKTLERGGWKGFYQGLVPWAWIESSTTGGILLFTSSIVESVATGSYGLSKGTAGVLGGTVGGAAQAYLAMGVCTAAKTAEITRSKAVPTINSVDPSLRAVKVPSALDFFLETYRQGGIRAINKGVNAVAVRQATNWASRLGIARAAEEVIRDAKGYDRHAPLGPWEKVGASAVGVIRVEMQSLAKDTSTVRPEGKMTMFGTGRYILKENGLSGLFRGVTPRIALSTYRTICLVSLGDWVKQSRWISNAAANGTTGDGERGNRRNGKGGDGVAGGGNGIAGPEPLAKLVPTQ
ncbi:hypothetical protein JCM10212_001060 [Sporobolomyces blumeae]